MVLISLVLHIGAIAAVVIASGQGPLEPVAPRAYTVSLIDPAALGGALLRPGKAAGQRPKTSAKSPNEAAPKEPDPPAVKDKPGETVKHSRAASQVPEPKKELVKLTVKGTLKKEKKSRPRKTEKKEDPKPKTEKKTVKQKRKIEKKREQNVTSKQLNSFSKKQKQKKAALVTERTPKKVAKKATKDSVSVQERDKQRLSAAIERIRKNVEGNTRQPEQGDATQRRRGGRPSGSGGVQGIAFMMYTEQVKQRVKESWIVTQKKTGLKVVVQFGVRPSGAIIGVELVQSSGNYTFDQSALRAVHNANPLPPPPQEYQQEFLNQKVKVAFGK